MFLKLRSFSSGSEIIVNMDLVRRIEVKAQTSAPGGGQVAQMTVVGSRLYYSDKEGDHDAVRATPEQIYEMMYPPSDPDANVPRLYSFRPESAFKRSPGGTLDEQRAHMQRTDHATIIDSNRAWGWRCCNKDCEYS